MSIPVTQRAANVYSQSIHAALNDQEQESSQLLVENEDEIREAYLNCFEIQYQKADTEPNWFKQEFEQIGNQIFHQLSLNLITNQVNDVVSTELSLNRNEHIDASIDIQTEYNYCEFKGKRMILIGRYTNCDIQICEYNDVSCSRLHTMLLLLPEINKFALLDVGSLTGIKIEGRSTNRPCSSTRAGYRQPLLFEWQETIKVRLGSKSIVINPKTCVVCMENIRNIILQCGHFVLCDQCREQLPNNQCPVCRVYINNERQTMGAMSFIQQ